MRNLGENLEQIYNIIFRQKYNEKYSVQYIIYHIVVEEKIDFYGFHDKEEKFLKILVYDPKYIKPLCKILTSGIIMDIQFQTYEVKEK